MTDPRTSTTTNDLASYVSAALEQIDGVASGDVGAVLSVLRTLRQTASEQGLDALSERIQSAIERVEAEPDVAFQELEAVRGGVALADAFSDLAPPESTAANEPKKAAQSGAHPDVDPRIAMFCDEGLEHLESAEAALLEYEKRPDKTLVGEAFRALHTLKGNCGWLGLSAMEGAAHHLEDLLDSVRAGAKAFPPEMASGVLKEIDNLRDGLLELQKGHDPREEGSEHAEHEVETEAQARNAATFVRVDVQKLDNVFDEVGELITAVAAVVKSPDLEGLDLPHFQVATSQLARVAQALHDSATEMRMVPLESLFRKAARVVRDVASDLGKEVALHINGADIEVDRSIVETVTDPLLHLIRNAIDHGLESSSDRLRAGKPGQGNLYLGAHHEGTEVVVTVRDDGSGINVERLLQKARAAGLVKKDEQPSRQEILEFLFERGLSTSDEVSKYSGRGVGMDIVRSQVEAIRGNVRVKTAEGEGTTFFLHLPMRLAMIDTMVVRAGTAIYAFPLLSVTASTRIDGAVRTESPDLGTLVQMRGRTMPLVGFSDLYKSHTPSDSELVLVVDCGLHELCLRVDEIIGQRQVVVKPLGPYLGNVRAIVGCSLLGRGDLCLIVDPRQFPTILGRNVRKVAS